MNRIHVFRAGGAWHAKFIGPHADCVVRSFDTDTLVCPFMSKTEAAVVVRTLEERNPGALVFHCERCEQGLVERAS